MDGRDRKEEWNRWSEKKEERVREKRGERDRERERETRMKRERKERKIERDRVARTRTLGRKWNKTGAKGAKNP